jgi:Killing trait
MAREGQTSSARTTARSAAEPSPEEALAEVEFEVLGDMSAVALAEFYIANSQALGLAAHNAVATQQKTSIMALTATMSGVANILSLDPPTAAEAPIPSPPDTTPNQKDP